MTITPESVQQLLRSEDFGDRLRAVNQIRNLEPAIAFPLLQEAAADSSARVRYAAVSQIASTGQANIEVAYELLRDRLLHDSEVDVQSAAADAIGALHISDALPILTEVYHETPEWLLRFSIVAALGELGDRRALPILEDALQNGNELTQTAAISALGELGDPDTVPLIIPRAADPDWQVRYRVAQALGALGGDAARATLETLAQDEIEQVAQTARDGLSR